MKVKCHMTVAVMTTKPTNETPTTVPKREAASGAQCRHNQEINEIIDKSWREAIRGFQFIRNEKDPNK